MMDGNERFYAFGGLVVAILVLTGIMIFKEPAEGSLRIVDAAVGALTLALGAATNALFRSKTTEPINIEGKPIQPS